MQTTKQQTTKQQKTDQLLNNYFIQNTSKGIIDKIDIYKASAELENDINELIKLNKVPENDLNLIYKFKIDKNNITDINHSIINLESSLKDYSNTLTNIRNKISDNTAIDSNKLSINVTIIEGYDKKIKAVDSIRNNLRSKMLKQKPHTDWDNEVKLILAQEQQPIHIEDINIGNISNTLQQPIINMSNIGSIGGNIQIQVGSDGILKPTKKQEVYIKKDKANPQKDACCVTF